MITIGIVYFIQMGKSGDIKIGYTTNLKNRMKALQTGASEKLQLLGYIKGTVNTEHELHRQFAQYRTTGEWFQLKEEIVDYINEHNEQMTYALLEENKITVLQKMKK